MIVLKPNQTVGETFSRPWDRAQIICSVPSGVDVTLEMLAPDGQWVATDQTWTQGSTPNAFYMSREAVYRLTANGGGVTAELHRIGFT